MVLDLETGAFAFFDTSWHGNGNVPGMDLGLENDGKTLHALPGPGTVTPLDTTGEHDPRRCIDKVIQYHKTVDNDNYTLVAGRDICAAIAGDRIAVITVDVAADSARKSLTFHYSLWQRPETGGISTATGGVDSDLYRHPHP